MKPIQRRHDFSGKCTLKKENFFELYDAFASLSLIGRTPKWVIFTDPCTKGVFLGLHQFNGTLLQLHLFLCKKHQKMERFQIFSPGKLTTSHPFHVFWVSLTSLERAVHRPHANQQRYLHEGFKKVGWIQGIYQPTPLNQPEMV